MVLRSTEFCRKTDCLFGYTPTSCLATGKGAQLPRKSAVVDDSKTMRAWKVCAAAALMLTGGVLILSK